MRLAERQKLAAEKAREILAPDDYDTLVIAMRDRLPVRFKYTDRYSRYSQYHTEYVDSFLEFPETGFFAGSVNVWSFHELHEKSEQYNCERILDVSRIITLLDALLDPSTNVEFWGGPRPEEKVIRDLEWLPAEIAKQTDMSQTNQLVANWLAEHQSVTTIPVGGTDPDAVLTIYDVVVDGIRLSYSGINKSVIDFVRTILQKDALPEPLRRVIKGADFSTENYALEPTLLAEMEDGKIIFYGGRSIDVHLIAHEAGHEFAVQKWGDQDPPDDSEFARAFNSGEPFVSEYSHKIISEDFAEAVGMFVSDPAQLKKIAPLKYRAIKSLLGGH